MSGLLCVSCAKKPDITLPPQDEDHESYCITKEPPTDGTSPLDHSGIENIAYMAGKLASTSNYRVSIESDVTAQIVISYVQHVETQKDFLDGIMVTKDISTSAFFNTALQSCFMDDVVLTRKPLSNKVSDWNENMQWQDSAPKQYSTEQFLPVYGLPSTEFSIYVINEETLLTSSEVTDLGNGLYSQTYTFDPELSSVYYRARMMTMGGLDGLPELHTITATYVFDSEWQVKSSHYEENYAFKLNSLIKSENTIAVTDSTYSYGNADVSDYDNFFSKYRELPTEEPVEEEKELTAGDCLMNAFAPVLGGSATYDVELGFRDRTLDASIYLELAESTFIFALGDLTLGYNGSNVILAYHDLNGRIPLTTLLSYISSDIGDGSTDLGNLDFDTDSILDSFAEGEFSAYPDYATLDTEISLGEIDLPLSFCFNIDGDEITLRYLKTSIIFEDEPIEITLTEGKGKITMPRGTSDLSSYLDLIFNFIKTDAYSFHIVYDQDVFVDANLVYAPSDGLSGIVSLAYEDLSLTADVALVQNTVYLDLHSIGEEEVSLKLKCSLDSLGVSLPSVFDEVSDDSVVISDLLYEILSLDFDEIILSLKANRNLMTMTLDLDQVLTLLDVDFEIGTIDVSATGEELTAHVLGIDLSARPNGEYVSPEGEYQDLAPVVTALPDVISFVSLENYYASLDATLEYGGHRYPIKGELKLYNKDDLWRYIFTISINGIRVDLVYEKGEFITLIFPNLNMEIKARQHEFITLIQNLTGNISIGSGGELETVLALAPIINGLQLFSTEDSLFGIEADLSSLLDGLKIRAKLNSQEILLTASDLSVDTAKISNISILLTSGENKSIRYKETYSVLFSGDVYDLITFVRTDAYAISAHNDLLSVDATVSLSGKAWGTITISDRELTFAFDNDVIYLAYGDLKVKTSLSALTSALERLLGPSSNEEIAQTSDLIHSILNLNFHKIKLVSRGGLLHATIYLHDLLLGFGLNVDIDQVDLDYYYSNHMLSTSLFGIDIDVTRAETSSHHVDSSSYVSLDALLRSDFLEIALSKNYALSLEANLVANGNSYPITTDIKVYDDNGWKAELLLTINQTEIYFSIVGDNFTLILPEFNLQIDGKLEDLESVIASLDQAVPFAEEEEPDILGIVLPLIDGLKTIEDKDSLLAFSLDLSSLLDGVVLTVRLYNGEITLEISDVTFEGVTIEGIGITVKNGKDTKIEKPNEDHLITTDELSKLLSFIDSDYYKLSASYSDIDVDATISLDGTVVGTLNFLEKELNFAFIDSVVYLALDDIKVQCGLDAILEAVSNILDENDVPDSSLSLEVADLIETIIDLDLSNLSFETNENELTIQIKLKELLASFGISLDIDDVALTYHYADETFTTELYGVSVKLEKANTMPTLTGMDEYQVLDEFIRSIQDAITFEGDFSIKVESTDIAVHLLGELNFENSLVLLGIATIDLGDMTVYASFQYDGEVIVLSFGDFGIKIKNGDLEALKDEIVTTYESLLDSVRNAPEGSKELVRKFVTVIVALELFDNIDLEEIFNQADDALNGGADNASEVLDDILDFLLEDDRFSVTANGAELKVIMHVPAVDELTISDVSLLLRPTKGEVAQNELYDYAQGADLWGLKEAKQILSTVRATIGLVENSYYTLGFHFDIQNDSADYTAYGGKRFDASGMLRIYTGNDPSINGSYLEIVLNLIASNHDIDGDLYLNFLVYDGDNDGESDFYIQASQYPEGDAKRVPLKLAASQGELRKLFETVFTIMGIDFKLYDDILTDDMISRIETFAKSLDLSDLSSSLGDLTDKAGGVIDSLGDEGLINTYLKELSMTDGNVTLRLDGARLFGKDGLSDLTVTLEVSDSDVMEKISVSNIYLVSETSVESIDIVLTMNCDDFAVGVPSDLSSYIFADGIYDMLTMLISSAEHTEDGKYVINDRYILQGSVNLLLFNLFNVEDIGLSLDIRLNDDGVQVLIRTEVDAFIAVIKGDTVTDITVNVPNNGTPTVQMRRVQTSHFGGFLGIVEQQDNPPIIIYRSMTLNQFMDTMMDQLGFALNLSDTILDQIAGSGSSGGGGDTTPTQSPDYGEYLKSFAKTSSAYNVTLNASALIGNLLSDITLGLGYDNGNLTSLNVNTSIPVLAGINASVELKNPGEKYLTVTTSPCENVKDETIKLFGDLYDEAESIEGQTIVLTFKPGSDTFTERYIPGSNASVAPDLAGYERVGYDSAWNADHKLATANTTYTVVYTPKTYVVTLVSEYAVDGFALADGKYSKTLSYTYDTILELPSVIIDSDDYVFGGWLYEGTQISSIHNIVEDVELTMRLSDEFVRLTLSFNGVTATGTTEGTANYSLDSSLPNLESADHVFLGWWSDYEGEWKEYTDISAIPTNTTLTAMWISSSSVLTASNVNRTTSGSILRRTYTVTATLTVAPIAVSTQIADQVTLTYAIKWDITSSSNTPSYSNTINGLTGNITKSQTFTALTHVHAVANIAYAVGSHNGTVSSNVIAQSVS